MGVICMLGLRNIWGWCSSIVQVLRTALQEAQADCEMQSAELKEAATRYAMLEEACPTLFLSYLVGERCCSL